MSWLKEVSFLDDWYYEYTDWYVIFEHGDMPWLLSNLLQPGFRHVWAVRWDGFNWIAFNPRLGATTIEILPFGPKDKIQNVVNVTNCSVIIHVNVRQNHSRIRNPWPTLFTCVEQMKGLLGIGGIKTWWIYRPYQLFKYLIKEPRYGAQTISTTTTTSSQDEG
jgi:hypothetical protein